MESINALGRRKAAVARVYLNDGKGNITLSEGEDIEAPVSELDLSNAIYLKNIACLGHLPNIKTLNLTNMENANITTVAWTGIINSDPSMLYISLRKTRYSYDIINNRKEFVINMDSYGKMVQITILFPMIN